MSKLDALMDEINKEWKADIVHKGVSAYDYERIPFTSPRMNYITFGGLPIGRLIEFFGEEHGGKTTTALDIVANYQQMEDARSVLWVDAENTLDSVWATKLGVDVDDMILLSPENQSAEQIYEKTLRLIDTGEVGLVVIDSIAVMLSQQALDKSVEEQTRGGGAKALTRFSNEAEMLCKKHKCTLIGINQLRDKMDSLYGGTTTTGGRGWRHNTSVRIEFRRGKFFDEKYKDMSREAENPVGNYVTVSMSKNKTCPPTRHTGFYTLRYDIGIDYLYDLTEVAIKYGIIEGSSWLTIKDVTNGDIIKDKIHGRAGLSKLLEEDAEILQKLEELVDEQMQVA